VQYSASPQEPAIGHTPAAGEVVGRRVADGLPIRLVWHDGLISRLEHIKDEPRLDQWIAPPLFDLQVNGYGGVDFQQEQLTAENLLTATRKLCADGCARFLLTLITDQWSALTARLRHLRSLRAQSPELQTAIAGWHIEGPFLSAELGFAGAHNPKLMCDPVPEHILELRTITGDDPVLLTVAPERSGVLKVIPLALAHGMKVSLGHTNASSESICEAIRLGASGFTHLGNGCPGELDRHDNVLWRVFETPELTVGLIPDQIHVSPALFRLMHREMPNRIYYATDAMAAASMPPGRYKLGSMELEVGPDQVVRHPGTQLFAGSALRPIDGVFRAARMLNCSWRETWARFSEKPAALMGLQHGLSVGQPADFCVLKVLGDNHLIELRTFSAC
jgi:N-acetylglucosamine-6-phosphate deacetylase